LTRCAPRDGSREAGAPEAVAEAIAEVLYESRELDLSQLATKTDLEQLHHPTKADLDQLRPALPRRSPRS
jgi:hypothetical protein